MAAAAAAALVITPRYYGEGAQERRAMAAIERFAGEKVDSELRGRRPYIGGEVMRFTYTTRAGPVDYYVDPETNRVMRMDDFGHTARKRAVRRFDALRTATAFAQAHFDGFGEAGLELTQQDFVNHGRDAAKYYAFTWTKKDSASGALLPTVVSVSVDAETGTVFSYNSLDAKVTIDTAPSVGRAIALTEALQAVADSVPAARAAGATLAVATNPPDNPRGKQALIWQIVIEGSDDAGYATGAFVYVDGQSGDVLKVDSFQ